MAKKDIPADSASSAKKSGISSNPIRNQIILAAVCLALGVAILVQPYFIRDYCGYVIGGLLCLIGVAFIIIYALRKTVDGVYRTELCSALVLLAAGAYVIAASVKPNAAGISITLRLIVTGMGVLIAVDGALKLQYAVDLARMRFGAWWVGLLLSLLSGALGVMTAMGIIDGLGVRLGLLGDEFLGAMLALGTAFILNALLDAGMAVLVSVRNRRAAKAAVPTPPPAPPAPEPGVYPPPQDPTPRY